MRENSNGKYEPNRTLPGEHTIGVKPAKVLRATVAPLRRRILRELHEVGEARSPAEVASAMHMRVTSIAYHIKVLSECGVITLTDARPSRGAIEHFYASTVTADDLALKILRTTRTEDEDGSRS
jgi:DNA-binding transcriptional ArsR family regulator